VRSFSRQSRLRCLFFSGRDGRPFSKEQQLLCRCARTDFSTATRGWRQSREDNGECGGGGERGLSPIVSRAAASQAGRQDGHLPVASTASAAAAADWCRAGTASSALLPVYCLDGPPTPPSPAPVAHPAGPRPRERQKSAAADARAAVSLAPCTSSPPCLVILFLSVLSL